MYITHILSMKLRDRWRFILSYGRTYKWISGTKRTRQMTTCWEKRNPQQILNFLVLDADADEFVPLQLASPCVQQRFIETEKWVSGIFIGFRFILSRLVDLSRLAVFSCLSVFLQRPPPHRLIAALVCFLRYVCSSLTQAQEVSHLELEVNFCRIVLSIIQLAKNPKV